MSSLLYTNRNHCPNRTTLFLAALLSQDDCTPRSRSASLGNPSRSQSTLPPQPHLTASTYGINPLLILLVFGLHHHRNHIQHRCRNPGMQVLPHSFQSAPSKPFHQPLDQQPYPHRNGSPPVITTRLHCGYRHLINHRPPPHHLSMFIIGITPPTAQPPATRMNTAGWLIHGPSLEWYKKYYFKPSSNPTIAC